MVRPDSSQDTSTEGLAPGVGLASNASHEAQEDWFVLPHNRACIKQRDPIMLCSKDLLVLVIIVNDLLLSQCWWWLHHWRLPWTWWLHVGSSSPLLLPLGQLLV